MLWKHHLSPVTYIARELMRVIFICDMSYETKIGERILFLNYVLGIVINSDIVISGNGIFERNVTVGASNSLTVFSVLGNDCMLEAGAELLVL